MSAPHSGDKSAGFTGLILGAIAIFIIIVATHSPMLLAFPGARIYSFDRGAIEEVPYAELDHVVLMREFLNQPERYLRAIAR